MSSSPVIRPYRYKTISRPESDLQNRFFECDYGLSLHLGSDVYTVHLEPGDSHSQNTLPGSLAAHVSLDEGLQFQFYPQASLLAAILADIAPLAELINMPEDIRGAVLEAAMERMLEQIDQLAGSRSTIQRLSHASDNDRGPGEESAVFFKLTRMRDGFASFGRIQTSSDGLEWIAGKLARMQGRVFRGLGYLPLTAGIEIGRAMLTVAEIRQLKPCDMILCPDRSSSAQREIRIRFSSNLSLAGNRVKPGALLIRRVIMKENVGSSEMSEKTKITAGLPDAALEDIPIKLIFEVGRTEVSLGELRRIQPGYTLKVADLPDVHKPVTIKANGVAVGKGELVYIEDLLGIRILEFNNEGGKPAEKPRAAADLKNANERL